MCDQSAEQQRDGLSGRQELAMSTLRCRRGLPYEAKSLPSGEEREYHVRVGVPNRKFWLIASWPPSDYFDCGSNLVHSHPFRLPGFVVPELGLDVITGCVRAHASVPSGVFYHLHHISSSGRLHAPRLFSTSATESGSPRTHAKPSPCAFDTLPRSTSQPAGRTLDPLF